MSRCHGSKISGSQQNFCPANLAEKTKISTSMNFLCTIAFTFLPLFANTNGHLCSVEKNCWDPEILLPR